MGGDTADVVIVGAGMAGVAAAHALAVERGVRRVCLVDPGEPLGLTSSRGTEAYRNWWPSLPMVQLMNRSIDRLEALDAESGQAFALNRRGYVFLTARSAERDRWRDEARTIGALGAGALREHRGLDSYTPSTPEGWRDAPVGADLIDSPDAVARLFPFVRTDAIAALHVRRAGWMNARALGAYLLARAEQAGVTVLRDRVIGVEPGPVVRTRLVSGTELESGAVLLCPGPHFPELLAQLGSPLKVVNELHGKVAIEDRAGIVPREVPLMIWNDPLTLDIAGEARLFPAGVHFRPRGDHTLLGIWTYDARTSPALFPPQFEPDYAAVLCAGLRAMIPNLRADPTAAIVDGGYYAKTPDNRPLIGPLGPPGVFALGALSGFGVMASQAAAELAALHLLGQAVPDYALAFLPSRFDDPAYVGSLDAAASGQL